MQTYRYSKQIHKFLKTFPITYTSTYLKKIFTMTNTHFKLLYKYKSCL